MPLAALPAGDAFCSAPEQWEPPQFHAVRTAGFRAGQALRGAGAAIFTALLDHTYSASCAPEIISKVFEEKVDIVKEDWLSAACRGIRCSRDVNFYVPDYYASIPPWLCEIGPVRPG